VNIDRALMIIEIFLLVIVVAQGEFIRYYEREVHRIQSEREKERAEWRQAKRKQQTKKAESTSTATSETPKVPAA
jgi:hypothetical protein